MDISENDCLISDNPLTFASNIKKLLKNEKFYSDVSDKTTLYFKNNFSEKNAEKILKEVLDD